LGILILSILNVVATFLDTVVFSEQYSALQVSPLEIDLFPDLT
jgi:hypothetical protein